MFGFFKKKLPADPPTEKQLRYAKRLGLEIKPRMSKWDVSAAIQSMENANPKLEKSREKVRTKVRERKLGAELVAEEARWQQFAEGTEYMLAIFRRRKGIIVDVLRVNDAWINNRGKLILLVAEPKLVKAPDIGDYISWEKEFELPSDNLLHHEPLYGGFVGDGIEAYRKIIKKGLKKARKL